MTRDKNPTWNYPRFIIVIVQNDGVDFVRFARKEIRELQINW